MIECTVPPSSTCTTNCDSEMVSADFHHCIIEADNFFYMEQIYIIFANISCYCTPNNNDQNSCSCNDDYDHFAPSNCSIVRPTQTTHVQVQPTLLPNTEVLATSIPFTTSIDITTTTTTTTTTTVTNTTIVSVVVPAVTVTTLLCISIATGSSLLCALCMKKRKQDLTTLHSDSKDQQKYNA